MPGPFAGYSPASLPLKKQNRNTAWEVGVVVKAAKVKFEDGLMTLEKFILTYPDISFIVGKLCGFIPILLPFLLSW